MLSPGRDTSKKLKDILMADRPEQFGQLGPVESMFVAKENLIEFCLYKRTNHAARMAQKMYVERVLKINLRALQDARMKSIRGSLINQRAISDPLLHEAIEVSGRETAILQSE